MSSLVSEKNSSAEVASMLAQLAEHGLFNELRKDALTNFQRLGLPGNKSEEYKHTPLTRLLEKNFSFSKASSINGKMNKGAIINGVDGYVLVFVNGKYSPSDSSIENQEDGLTLLPISEAAKINTDELRSHLGKIADYSTDAFAAWNTAAWTDGVFVKVEKNKIVKKPILIYHIHDCSEGQVITSLRNLVILGQSSEVTILEKQDTFGSGNGFSTVVSEGIVSQNAGLTWYSIQNDNGNRYHFDFKQLNQLGSSRINTFTFTLNGKAIRNNLNLGLDGEGIESHMYGLYLIGKDTLADNHTVVDHKQPNSFSNELYKGIMDDNSKGVFNGKIYVRPNAQKTNAFQANKNILLTDRASVNTKPQLEIWADDVKCSHGCTSGQLDEEALFYLRARGINKDIAQAMMLYAFAGELVENIKNEGLKEYIDRLISERLHKNF